MSSTPGGQGEGVYCHQCDNEWLMQDHGLVCPRCQSDFVEVIERDTQDDPRDDRFSIDGLGADFGTLPFTWPDPPSPEFHSDSSRETGSPFTWGSSAPSSATFSNSMTHETQYIRGSPPPPPFSRGSPPPPPQPATGALGGILGFLSNALGGQTQQQATSNGPSSTRTTTWHSPTGNAHFSMTMSTTSYSPGQGGARPMTPMSPTDLNSFMNDLFRAPLSPGGSQRSPGFGMPTGDSTTLLDVLLGGRLGLPGQYAQSQEDFDRIISDIMERTQGGSGAPAASEDAIAHLPKKQADAKMLGDSGKAECTICMAEVTTGEVVTELYCKHWFHPDCIKAWLEQHNTCPHCRMSVEEAKQNFERKQREMAANEQPKSAEVDSERKRKRGSIASILDDGRSRAANSPRMPGMFPPSSASGQDLVGSASDGRPAAMQVEADSSNAHMSRLRSSFLARNPTPSYLEPNPPSPPRRARSGDMRTLYAARDDHVYEQPRRASRPTRRDSPYDRRERHASHDAYSAQRRHSTYEQHDHTNEEQPSLFARARGWLSGR